MELDAGPTGETRVRDYCFHWIGWWQVETVQPACRATGENSLRQPAYDRLQLEHWVVLELCPPINATPDSSPGLAGQLAPAQAREAGIFERE